MAETPSRMVELGTALPHFRLPDISGRVITDRDVSDQAALVIAFICPHCPYVNMSALRLSPLPTTISRAGWRSSLSTRTTPRRSRTTMFTG